MTARTSGTGTCLTAKSLDISLAALRRQDPYINNIVDVASQVALYTFSNRANEWEKTDVEGTLFVYTRLASPRHGFTIMNRLSMENLTEPITKDLDFQLQDPFLLYRNARLSIYGIWFYDKEDCQRIAELMKNLTRQEQLLAQQGAGVSPGDSKGVDILQMLTKARDEYDKGKPSSEPKEIVCSSVIHDNPNLIKPIPVKPLERQPGPQQSTQDSDQKPKQLSLAALFGGTSQPKPVSPQAESGGGRGGGLRPAVARSLSYEEASQTAVVRPASGSPPQPCPAIQKLMNVQRGPAELLQPVPESPENHPCENGGRPLAHHCQGRNTLQGLFHSSAPTCHSLPPPPHHPLLHCPQPAQSDLGQSLGFGGAHVQAQPLFFSPSKPQLVPPSQPSQVSPHELLQRLQLVQKEQGLTGEPARPVLAPRFQEPPLPSVRQLDSWADKTSASPVVSSSHKPSPLYQVISPQRIPATVAPSLLLSPMVFTQAKSAAKSGVDPRPPAVPLQVPEEPRALTKCQLQATLLHLIQNDAAFLETIYEAYISCSARDSTAKHF